MRCRVCGEQVTRSDGYWWHLRRDGSELDLYCHTGDGAMAEPEDN